MNTTEKPIRIANSTNGDDLMQINYLREINAFIDWLEINPLDATTQALWLHLMAIANKSGWPEWFTVANLTLMAKLGGITKATLSKHRNILIQKGRIEYQNQGKQAGKYKIIPFYPNDIGSKNEPNLEPIREPKDIGSKIEPLCEPQREPNLEPIREPIRLPLDKLNETKNKDLYTTTAAEAAVETSDPHDISPIIEFYEQNGFGTVPSTLLDDLNHWIDKNFFDEPIDIIIRAMKEACQHNVRKWRYVDKILTNWSGMNLRTLKQVEAYLREFENRKRKDNRLETEMDKPKKPKEPDIDPFLIRYGFRKVSDNAT